MEDTRSSQGGSSVTSSADGRDRPAPERRERESDSVAHRPPGEAEGAFAPQLDRLRSATGSLLAYIEHLEGEVARLRARRSTDD